MCSSRRFKGRGKNNLVSTEALEQPTCDPFIIIWIYEEPAFIQLITNAMKTRGTCLLFMFWAIAKELFTHRSGRSRGGTGIEYWSLPQLSNSGLCGVMTVTTVYRLHWEDMSHVQDRNLAPSCIHGYVFFFCFSTLSYKLSFTPCTERRGPQPELSQYNSVNLMFTVA